MKGQSPGTEEQEDKHWGAFWLCFGGFPFFWGIFIYGMYVVPVEAGGGYYYARDLASLFFVLNALFAVLIEFVCIFKCKYLVRHAIGRIGVIAALHLLVVSICFLWSMHFPPLDVYMLKGLSRGGGLKFSLSYTGAAFFLIFPLLLLLERSRLLLERK